MFFKTTYHPNHEVFHCSLISVISWFISLTIFVFIGRNIRSTVFWTVLYITTAIHLMASQVIVGHNDNNSNPFLFMSFAAILLQSWSLFRLLPLGLRVVRRIVFWKLVITLTAVDLMAYHFRSDPYGHRIESHLTNKRLVFWLLSTIGITFLISSLIIRLLKTLQRLLQSVFKCIAIGLRHRLSTPKQSKASIRKKIESIEIVEQWLKRKEDYDFQRNEYRIQRRQSITDFFERKANNTELVEQWLRRNDEYDLWRNQMIFDSILRKAKSIESVEHYFRRNDKYYLTVLYPSNEPLYYW